MDVCTDGGILVPKELTRGLLRYVFGDYRRASKGFRKHARSLKRSGLWRGDAVSHYGKRVAT